MAEYSDKLGAYDEAVVFDDATADRLISAAQTLSSTLTTQGSDRTSWATTASTDFEGHYADVFDTNSKAGSTDCTNISSALNDLVSEVQALKTAAAAEKSRRAQAKEWADRQDHETFLKKGWDWLTSQDQAPPGPDQVPLPQPHEPVTSSWSEPAPAASGSVSSACPQDLRTYATNISGANDTAVTQKGTLDGAISDFATACAWCTIDASGITAALTSFTSNNTGEAAWVNTVADAFEAAGGGDGGISTVSDEAIAACLEAAGVAENRKPLDVASPQIMGDPQTSGYADDPVNTTTGNFVEPEADLVFTGAGASLEFERVYNSVSSSHDSDDAPAAGAFGPGWSSTADERLVVDDEGATWVRATGRHVVFPRAGAGWGRAVGENLWLEALDAAGTGADDTASAGGDDSTAAGARDAGGFVVSDNEGGRWCFDVAGRPAWWSRGAGTRVERSYDSSGRLAGLAHERGRGVDVVWDGAGSRIAALVARDGRRADFSYDSSGRLVGVTRSGGGARRYEWGEESGRIERVVDADGVVEADNAYDEAGRVVRQRSAFGRVSHYSYLPGGVTQVADADGSRANVWVHDARGRLTGMIDAAGNRQSIGWDRWGNRVMVTGRDGGRTINQYDGRGRLSMRVEETGARLSYDYDDADRVVRVRADDGSGAAAVTAYEYAGADRNPRVITDPEGGVTRLDWQDGLLVGAVDPVGVRVRLGYDEHGELTSVTNAVGDTARLERDGAGRITASITPSGRRTQYRYDAAGNLVSRRDPDGATWRWEHTPGGRPCAMIDPTGARTAIDYGEHGAEQTTTDPMGRSITMGYDDVGNTASAVLPDGSTWDFAHDALSRLRSVTDPTGARAVLEYTSTGDVAHSVDPTGVEQEFEHGPVGLPTAARDEESAIGARWDRLGRLVERIDADGSRRVLAYDRCGRLIESVDEMGGVTRIERDAAGRAVRVVKPSGASFAYEYDECGRWCATVSTGGARYEMTYDADGNIVGETWPTGERVSTTFDECGRIVERFEPGRGRTRFTYDACGRIASMRDTWNGHRRFAYNASGQLVSVTNGLGAVTRFDYDERGQRVGMTDPMGGRSRCAYDETGRVVSITDPEGRTTRFTYDAAGRPTSRLDDEGRGVSWSYDATGRYAATWADGRMLSSVSRDWARRSCTVRGGGYTDELVWDACGRLVERGRDGRSVRWTYDADGHRTSMVHPDGSRTRYEYDDDERIRVVEHPDLGRLVVERDWLGRVTGAEAPGVRATWTWGSGGVVAHRVERDGFVRTMSIERDADGRVVSQVVDGVRTEFSYDAAGQLVEAVSGEGIVTSFDWDLNGRLAAQTSDGRRSEFDYDAAGQLLRARRPDGSQTTYDYDASGRRTGEEDGDVSRTFDWDPRGFLERITTTGSWGSSVHELDVDGLGELARVDGKEVMWDESPGGGVVAQLGEFPVVDVGFALGAGGPGGGWLMPERPGRDARAGLWEAGAVVRPAGSDGSDGVGLSSTGALSVDGLTWLGARVYDPATRSFLSRDPLPPVLGAGWAANPYSWAGNDPVNLADPSGAHPLTDAEMEAWRDAHKTGLAAVGDYLADNWQYIVGGIVLGTVLTAACGPVLGGALTGAIISGWQNADQQAASGGPFDVGGFARAVVLGGASGAIGGAVAEGVAGTALARGMGCLGRSTFVGGVSGTVAGGFDGAAGYLTGPGPHTVGGFLGATGGGAVFGGFTGAGVGALSSVTDVSRFGCFPAGTRVLMADGTAKPIEDVEAGDRVASVDPDTGRPATATVTATFTHRDVDALRITTDRGELVTTAAHPLYAQGRGFVPAGDLRPGDVLRDADGPAARVIRVRPAGLARTVHNIEVDTTHAYYVATTTGTWTLAHNGCTTEDLYAAGNLEGPKGARPRDFGISDLSERVGPQPRPTSPADDIKGASTAISMETLQATGQVHRIPAGTELPEGLAVHADGEDVVVNGVKGTAPEGHRTVYSTDPTITGNEFNRRFRGMGWEHVGKK